MTQSSFYEFEPDNEMFSQETSIEELLESTLSHLTELKKAYL
jgi:hypothetical protein